MLRMLPAKGGVLFYPIFSYHDTSVKLISEAAVLFVQRLFLFLMII